MTFLLELTPYLNMNEQENEEWTVILKNVKSQENILGNNFKHIEIQNKNYLFCNEEYNIFINTDEYCLYDNQLTRAEINHSEKKIYLYPSIQFTEKIEEIKNMIKNYHPEKFYLHTFLGSTVILAFMTLIPRKRYNSSDLLLFSGSFYMAITSFKNLTGSISE